MLPGIEACQGNYADCHDAFSVRARRRSPPTRPRIVPGAVQRPRSSSTTSNPDYDAACNHCSRTNTGKPTEMHYGSAKRQRQLGSVYSSSGTAHLRFQCLAPKARARTSFEVSIRSAGHARRFDGGRLFVGVTIPRRFAAPKRRHTAAGRASSRPARRRPRASLARIVNGDNDCGLTRHDTVPTTRHSWGFFRQRDVAFHDRLNLTAACGRVDTKPTINPLPGTPPHGHRERTGLLDGPESLWRRGRHPPQSTPLDSFNALVTACRRLPITDPSGLRPRFRRRTGALSAIRSEVGGSQHATGAAQSSAMRAIPNEKGSTTSPYTAHAVLSPDDHPYFFLMDVTIARRRCRFSAPRSHPVAMSGRLGIRARSGASGSVLEGAARLEVAPCSSRRDSR